MSSKSAIVMEGVASWDSVPFQLIETGIFLALALALAGFCFQRLGRRLS